MSGDNFVLLGTIHDVKGKNKALFEACIDEIKGIYEDIYVTISDVTSADFIGVVKKSGINYKIIEKKGAADARRNVLNFGLTDNNAEYYHYCDFDRVLVWAEDNYNELRSLRNSIGDTDYLVIGRTAKAFLSHPKTWQETELVTNHMFEIYYGKKADITAGSCILSRRAAEIVAEFSRAAVTDGEWPSILLKRKYKVDCFYVDGLKYIDKINGVTNPQRLSRELMDRLNLSRKICESICEIYS